MIFRSLLFYSFVIFLTFTSGNSLAVNGNAIVSGDWNNPQTWNFNGVNRQPGCGDTINIPAGRTVTVNTQEDLSACSTPNVMFVYGTLQFVNGYKIDFPCGSWVYIMSGGLIRKISPGGGNSTLISICGFVEWKAGDGNLPGVDTLGGHGSLPVEWLSLNATLVGNEVKVEWSTATEINNDYFDVTRSADGIHFEKIGSVDGSGNSTQTIHYSFPDAQPLSGISYYRLRQVDYDGTVDYSEVVAVNNKNRKKITDLVIFGGTEYSESFVSFYAPGPGTASLDLLSVTGSHIGTRVLSFSGGNNRIALTEADVLAKGVYLGVFRPENEAGIPVKFSKQ